MPYWALSQGTGVVTEGLSVGLRFLQLEDNERTGVDADVFCDSLMWKQLCSQLRVWPTIEHLMMEGP